MGKSIGAAGSIHQANRRCMFFRAMLLLIVALSLLFSPASSWAAPFSKYFHFTQPDKTEITLWGEGDEFHAVFETTTGYTVVFDPQQRTYFYAKLSTDGKSLLSTGVKAHDPVPQGLAQHVRPDRAAAAAAARARRKQWDAETGLSKRWSQLKSQTLGTPLAPDEAGALLAPPSTTTVGSKAGLTLLIDFSDAPATIGSTEIASFLNGDSYTGFTNNGSVKKYFSDVSGGRLTYTNVVTIYVRMTQPKSYYDNTAIDCGTQGRLLINDALAILKARSDYTSTILPTFNALTADGSGNVAAFNVYFAGADSGSWTYGLWPHSWVLASPVALGNGKSVSNYQITNVGSSLELGTFCHENGHMLCGFPDIYDYDYDSKGGAGAFCLMNSGGHGANPAQVDAYLKLAAGWATVTDLDSTSSQAGTLVAAPGSGYDTLYRYRRPGVATEYFLLENRQKTGRDAGLPAAGIAVWHVDELGDRDNQSLTPNSSHLNYELTLVQADNLWHFENNVNAGDASYLYYQGNTATAYTNRLDDTTAPNALWWDGAASGMNLNTFSAVGQTMTFKIGAGEIAAPVLNAEPATTSGTTNTIAWSAVTPMAGISPVVKPQQVAQTATTSSIVTGTLASTPATGNAVASGDTPQPGNVTLNLEKATVSGTGEGPAPLPSVLLTPSNILNETFEGAFPGTNWALDGSPTWGATNNDKHGGSWSGWCAKSTRSPADGYADNMGAWMIYGPFDLTGATSSTSAILSFWYKNYSELNYDKFWWAASVDGIQFSGYWISGDQNSWRNQTFDLATVPTLGDLRGKSQVWVAFYFSSDSSVSGPTYTGAYVDDVVLSMGTPDLTVDKPANWTYNIPVETSQLSYDAAHNGTGPYYDDQILYYNWRSANQGTATAAGYKVHVEVTGTGGGSWDMSGLNTNGSGWTTLTNDQAFGPLAAGTHTLKVWVDYDNTVNESNEANNYYERTITVTARPVEYYAECANNSGFTSPVNSGWITQTQTTFSNLTPGQAYWYRVKARKGGTLSGWSNVVYSQQQIATTQTLSVTIAGNGSGSVNSDPAGIAMSTGMGTRTVPFPKDSPVTLMATPAASSMFSGWSGACTNAVGDCVVTMSSDKAVSAYFNSYPVRISGTTPVYYSSLVAAYENVTDGGTIQAQAAHFIDNLLVYRSNIDFTLQGGFDNAFTNRTGDTSLHGLTIQSGSVTVDRITIN